jgi:hypothetical protein
VTAARYQTPVYEAGHGRLGPIRSITGRWVNLGVGRKISPEGKLCIKAAKICIKGEDRGMNKEGKGCEQSWTGQRCGMNRPGEAKRSLSLEGLMNHAMELEPHCSDDRELWKAEKQG